MYMKKFIAHPRYPEKLQKLYRLAYNLYFAWNYEVINLFYRIDPQLFRTCEHNPVRFLYNLPEEKTASLAQDEGFLFELEKVWSKFNSYLNYQPILECPGDSAVAYFSMEYGLHESIPIYAGGLGILAGDFLKGASDLGIPILGVGLLYSHGYFTQRIDPSGNQRELEKHPYDKSVIPVKELRGPEGKNPVVINCEFAGQLIKAKLWQADIGKTKLLLMDTDIEDNTPYARALTDGLYPADREKRILQEMLLGVGGIQALSAAGCLPNIYHLNEGHSAFLIAARLNHLMANESLSFSQAKAVIKASTVFTTHTPVVAGNENYPVETVKKYLGPELQKAGLDFDMIKNYGLLNGDSETFWLPAFAIHFAGFVNGVSRRHCEVAHRMWAPLFPNLSPLEIPIRHITNGVHNSWISEPFTDIFNRYLGPNYIHSTQEDKIWEKIYEIPDEEIWKAHRRNKQDMVVFLRKRLTESFSSRGYSPSRISEFTKKLNPDSLTIVFARRFASYKRPGLLMNDAQKLKEILSKADKPVQLIFAGKAHPADEQGKKMIKQVMDFAVDAEMEDRIFFFENYDINLARHLVWGSDVWLNTPVEYMEASGTSGMKAGMNGVLNLSVTDGWWVEGCNGKNGWGISAGEFISHPELRESAEANQIYTILDEEITEIYYNRGELGIPERWIEMMKESLFSVCRKFNINRALTQYMNDAYIPCMEKTAKLKKDGGSLLKQAERREEQILKSWQDISFAGFDPGIDKIETITENQELSASCSVNLAGMDPKLFTVEIFYMPDEEEFIIIPLEMTGIENGLARYSGQFKVSGRGSQSLNVRIRPADPVVSEIHPELIKWKPGED